MKLHSLVNIRYYVIGLEFAGVDPIAFWRTVFVRGQAGGAPHYARTPPRQKATQLSAGSPQPRYVGHGSGYRRLADHLRKKSGDYPNILISWQGYKRLTC